MNESHYIQRRFNSDNSQEEAELLQIYNDHFKPYNVTFDQFLNTRLYPNSAATIAILEVVFSDTPTQPATASRQEAAIEVPGQARQERGDEV